MQEQLAAIALGDFELRRDGDAVHDTRVAIRRLRSTLHVFADVFDETEAVAFSDELSWFATMLGHIRDADVAGRHAEVLLEDADDSLDVASARNHLEARVAAEKVAGYDALAAGMSGRRYAALVSTMEEWRVEPPLTAQSTQPRKAADRYLTRTSKKLRKRLLAATKKHAGADDLHRARKVAKRLRYAAELADAAVPKRARSLRKEGKRWQRRLGELQDLRITAELLTELGDSAPTNADAFVFGVLAARAQHDTDQRYAAFVRKVD